MSELDVSGLLSVQQAVAIIDAAPVRPRVADVPLADAVGLHLADDVVADRDYPPFDKSMMDGYAVRAADLSPLPATLRVVGSVAAGQVPRGGVGPGEAMAIMTGAPLPEGADAVVPMEDVEGGAIVERPGSSVKVLAAPAPQRYVSRRGADAEKGMVALLAGQKVGPGQVAAAAAVGAHHLRCYAPPRVAVLATGDEVVPVDREPTGAQVRSSNNAMACALLRRLGCRVVDLGIAPDKPDAIRRAILKGLQLDALVVTGGMSVGAHDHVPAVLKDLGVELKVTKLRIKPGKPFVFGTADRAKAMHRSKEGHAHEEGDCHVFGLPGNPVSSFVCLTRLASRLLVRLAGGEVSDRFLHGRLIKALPANGPREFYQPVVVDYATGGVRPLEWKGSADVFTLALANGLLVRGENEPALGEGAVVRVIEV